MCALPNIWSGAIGVRVSVDAVNVRELTVKEYEGMKEIMKKKGTRVITPPEQTPSIKARLEVGKQVERFFPPDSLDVQDIIVMASIDGLDLSLLLPNVTVLKDFFDDEYESLKPLPLHLKVAGTRAVLVENVDHGADHPQSMVLGVDQLEIHKGRELAQGLDIFREDINRYNYSTYRFLQINNYTF